jgi:hypothetical protein
MDRHPRWKEILSQTFGSEFDRLSENEQFAVLDLVEGHFRSAPDFINLRAAALDFRGRFSIGTLKIEGLI